MTAPVDERTVPAPLLSCTSALLRRFTSAGVEPPATASTRDWVGMLLRHLPAPDACAVVTHLFGVLPLVDAFYPAASGAIAALRGGLKLGGLGLFTPTAEHGWGAAALAGTRVGGAVRLRGELRIPSAVADGSIVLVALGATEHRLAWLDHDAPGLERRASRGGGRRRRRGSPCWLAVDGATIDPAHVSRPLALAPHSELDEPLEAYVRAWSLVAVASARTTVRALRRAARTTPCSGLAAPLSTSQCVALDITEAEIETDLTAALADRCCGCGPVAPPPCSGIALALAAARALAAAAATANQLRDCVRVAGDEAGEDAARVLLAHVGGLPLLENQLARADRFGRSGSEQWSL